MGTGARDQVSTNGGSAEIGGAIGAQVVQGKTGPSLVDSTT